jgi:iron complex transport system substrate-binding protein
MRHLFSIVLLLFVLSIPLVAQDTPTITENLTEDCVSEYDETVDYFPDQVEVEYAEKFSVEYFDNHKVLTVVTPWEEEVRYVLVQCGTPVPQDIENATVIEVPVQSVVTTSTTFLPHIVDQNVVERVVGIDNLSFTNLPEVLERIEAGDIAEVYADFAPNREVLIELDPELIIMQDFAPDGASAQLREDGLTTALNYDFTDITPLGQVEWGKYIALFFNTEAVANENFETVVSEYQTLTALTEDVEDRPTVMASEPFQGSWFVPGGNSYSAQILEDAGADYLWSENEASGGFEVEFETVLDVASEADYWVNVNWTTLDAALEATPTFDAFAPVQDQTVYAYNNAVGTNGGNLYFEEGAANPHLVLADLITIFHPDLLPEHELIYYRQVPQTDE